MSGTQLIASSTPYRIQLASVAWGGRKIAGENPQLTLKNILVNRESQLQEQVPCLMIHIDNQGTAVETLDLRDFTSSHSQDGAGGRYTVEAFPSQNQLSFAYPKNSNDHTMVLVLQKDRDMPWIIKCFTDLGIQCSARQSMGMYYPPVFVSTGEVMVSKTPVPSVSPDMRGYQTMAFPQRPSSVPATVRVQRSMQGKPSHSYRRVLTQRARPGKVQPELAAIQEDMSGARRRSHKRHVKDLQGLRDDISYIDQGQYYRVSKRIHAQERDNHARKTDGKVLEVATIYEELLTKCTGLWNDAAKNCRVGDGRDELIAEWVAQGVELDRKLRQICAVAVRNLGEATIMSA